MTRQDPGKKQDLVDALAGEWALECPEFDLEGMHIVGRLIRLGSLLQARAETIVKPFGLIYTDFDILATLRRAGEPYSLTPTELMQSVLLTSGAMTAAMNRLENAGLLKRYRSENDRRSLSAQLTPAGSALAEKAAEMRFKDALQVSRLLPKKQVNHLAQSLRDLLLQLEEEAPKSNNIGSSH